MLKVLQIQALLHLKYLANFVSLNYRNCKWERELEKERWLMKERTREV